MPAGVIVNNYNEPERYGLGDVATRWPDLRMFIEGPKVSLQPDHSTAVVPFKIGWNNHQALCAELLGGPYQNQAGTGGPGTFSRHLPEPFKNWLWTLTRDIGGYENWALDVKVPVMHCTRILDVTGVGGAGEQSAVALGANYYPDPQYQFARVMALFETLAYDVALKSTLVDLPTKPLELNRYVIKREQSGGKFLTFQYGQWALRNGAGGTPTAPIARQLMFFEPQKTIRYEWLDVLPGMCNHARNEKVMGFTNSQEFDGYAAETLLLTLCDREPKRTPYGQRTYLHTFEMAYFPSGVNRALPPTQAQQNANGIDPDGNPVQPYWDIVDAPTMTQKPYKRKNYSDLFRP